MKIVKALVIVKQWVLNMFYGRPRVYWVFRKYVKYDEREINPIDVDFAIHFVKPFKNKKDAQKAVDFAKQLQPWQEFLILYGC